MAPPSVEQIASALAAGATDALQIQDELHRTAEAPRAYSANHAAASAVRPAAHPGQVSGRPQMARAYWVAATLAAAAAIGGVIASLTWQGPERDGPLFVARPVAELYREAVAAGFEPTYECKEPERFAATFQSRQGQPLQLLAMPARMRMLGLAYTGGLSRNTTAMLCRIDAMPVMVFVDRESADRPDAAAMTDASLHVFRAAHDGLVFYEVTPLAEPRAMQLLAPASAATGSGA